MLSKQVKARRTLNYNRRKIAALKEMRPRLKASLNTPMTQKFLSSRRLKNVSRLIRSMVDTPNLQEQLSSKHLLAATPAQARDLATRLANARRQARVDFLHGRLN